MSEQNKSPLNHLLTISLISRALKQLLSDAFSICFLRPYLHFPLFLFWVVSEPICQLFSVDALIASYTKGWEHKHKLYYSPGAILVPGQGGLAGAANPTQDYDVKQSRVKNRQ